MYRTLTGGVYLDSCFLLLRDRLPVFLRLALPLWFTRFCQRPFGLRLGRRIGVAGGLTAIGVAMTYLWFSSYWHLRQSLWAGAQAQAIVETTQIAQTLDHLVSAAAHPILTASLSHEAWATLTEGVSPAPQGDLFWQTASGELLAAPAARVSPDALWQDLKASPTPLPSLALRTIAAKSYYVVSVPLGMGKGTLIQVIPQSTLETPWGYLSLMAAVGGGVLLVSVGMGASLLRLCYRLRQERQRLQDLITHAPLPIALFDRQMRYLAYSNQWATDAIFVGPAQQSPRLGQPYPATLPAEPTVIPHSLRVADQADLNLAQFWQRLHARALQGERLESPEAVILYPNGEKIYLHWAIYPWHYLNGAIGGTVLAVDRIDELVQAREAALDVARMKSQFLANMSHEIRTPISGVLGMAELLASTQLSPKQQEFVNNLNSSAQHLLSIVNNILDFSKLEAGEMQLDPVKFDLYSCIEEVIDVLAHQFERKRIELAVFIDRDVPRQLEGDVGRLRQILLNLMGNAAKFTAADGEVSIRVALQANHGGSVLLRFEVKDTGVGIAPEAQAKLFQAFFQGDATTSRRYGGTGLGLAICKQLVERMGGTIGCQSQLGKGSTFWFTIQLGLADEEWVPTLPSALAGLKLLVVDPTTAVRRSLRSLLRGWGVKTIDEAVDAPAALESLRQAHQQGDPYDVAIVEFQLPWMDGDTLVRTITADPDLAHTRLVLMTSVSEQEHAEYLLQAGLASYLIKPLRATRLLDALLSAIRVSAPPAEPPLVAKAGTPGSSSTYPSAQMRPVTAAASLVPGQPQGWLPPVVPPPADLRILLVEDHPVNQEVLLTQLNLLGYTATLATNGQEALRILEQQPYDLVLMDCQMPILDGYATTKALRQLEQRQQAQRPGSTQRAVVIALTAHALPTDRQRCLAAGMDDYLSKPVSKAELARTLERWTAVRLPAVSSHASAVPPAPVDSLPVAQCPPQPPRQPAKRSRRGGSGESCHVSGAPVDLNSASPGGQAGTRPPLNLDRLRELFYKKPVSLQKFLQLFLENAQADVQGLQAAIADLPTPDLTQAAYDRLIHYSHRLKGSSANAGAIRLAELAAQLHTAAQHQQDDTVSQLVADVAQEFAQVCQFVNPVIQSAAPQ
ncbi:response regulator [Trichothermofontia sichuanensis B231]|uniref:hybrid sensor histidine kinase/response regulator n=1 Tax=Trichothermofontia sichuanensis TaxID=3045816 RepID=UPI0022476D36|nr:hybrid sensor histidine kinase/response regulator [Trichothermofontia sichuanensis]UZQ53222.1 response regulator [Trichothermofontia sichuanensis B231]